MFSGFIESACLCIHLDFKYTSLGHRQLACFLVNRSFSLITSCIFNKFILQVSGVNRFLNSRKVLNIDRHIIAIICTYFRCINCNIIRNLLCIIGQASGSADCTGIIECSVVSFFKWTI